MALLMEDEESGFLPDEEDLMARKRRHSGLESIITVLGYIVDLKKLAGKLVELFKKEKPQSKSELVIRISGVSNGKTITVRIGDQDDVEKQLRELL